MTGRVIRFHLVTEQAQLSSVSAGWVEGVLEDYPPPAPRLGLGHLLTLRITGIHVPSSDRLQPRGEAVPTPYFSFPDCSEITFSGLKKNSSWWMHSLS